MAKKKISPVTGSINSKIRSFGVLVPFAGSWYVSRFLRQKYFYLFYKYFGKYAFRKIGKNVRIDGAPDILYPCADIRLGDNVRIGKRCVFQGSNRSSIIIDDNVSINDGCFVTSMFEIVIGKNTSIGEYTSIRDYNHEFDDISKPIKDQAYFGDKILIGEDCWIGRGCVVLPGVSIGNGAVIGANSLVNKDIPSNTIAVGSPAKVIRTRGNKNKD